MREGLVDEVPGKGDGDGGDNAHGALSSCDSGHFQCGSKALLGGLRVREENKKEEKTRFSHREQRDSDDFSDKPGVLGVAETGTQKRRALQRNKGNAFVYMPPSLYKSLNTHKAPMDRDARREIRKRGAASRQLATSQDDVVIRTPKWVPVSRDSGALITEQMSLEHSPLYQRQYQGQPIGASGTPTRSGASLQRDRFIDPSILQKDQPRTPQERIGYTYEPVTNESNRSVVSSRPTPQKNKQHGLDSRSVSREAGPSSKRDSSQTQHKKRKPAQRNPKSKNPRKKSKKSQQKEPEDEYYNDTTSAHVSAPDDEYASLDEFILEEDSDDDAVGKHQKPSIEISRLPTTSNRLTGIDVVMHYLKVQVPNSAMFDNFDDLNQEMFAEILDLNLVNNHYAYQLRDVKNDKHELRKQILQRRREVGEQMAKLEKLRHDYNNVRTLLAAKWRIANKLRLAKEKAEQEGQSNSSSSSQVVEKLNKLNNVLDPHWSLVDKLRALNGHLYALDKQLKG